MVWLYIPSNFAQASACSAKVSAQHLSILESDIEPFATWSAKPLLPRNLSRLWRREPLIRRLSGLTFSRSMAQRGVDEWIASLPDFRAKTYLSPGVGQASTASAPVSSSVSPILPTLAVRGSSFWRTSRESLLPPPPLWTKRKANSPNAQLPESWENWPTAGGMRNGRIYERPMSVEAISASVGSVSHGGWATPDCNTSSYSNGEFGQNIRQQAMTWATPDANAMERTNRSPSQNAAERPTLALAARAWPMPRGTDGTKGGPNQRGSSGDPMLLSMAAQRSTPNVPSGGRSVSADVVSTRGKTANGKRQVGLESEVRHWATPRASMATNGCDSGSACRQAQGANPGLKDQVSQWATPTSSENSNRTTKSAPSHGNGHGMVLAGQAADFSTSLRPVRSMIDGRELSPTDRTLRRRLNPAFACWLMGWPTWWTNPGITNSVKSEMASYRSKLRSQLSLLLGEPGFSNRENNMAKNSIDVYGASGKGNVLSMDPDKLTLVTDPKHPLYDRRVHQAPSPKTVRNYRAQGVLEPVLFYKDPETGENLVIDGRRRVINARELNRLLIEAGEEPITIPAIPKRVMRDSDKSFVGMMVSTNEIREEDSPINRAEKMARMLDVGHTEDAIAIAFGVEVPTVRSALKLLDCCMAVRDAVEAEQITVSHALKLAKLSPDEQRAKVQALIDAAEGKEGHARSRALKAVLGGTAARVRPRKQIEAALAEASGERLAALRWVLGIDDAESAQEAAE